jgi:hypothetical protein
VAGTDDTADETETIGMHQRTAYKNGTTLVVEAYKVMGMGHATAVGADVTGTCVGTQGSYFEDRGICATMRAAKFLGLTGGGGTNPDVAPPTVAIVSPANGDTVTGAVTIVVAANDETKMGSVALTIDGTSVGEDTMAPFQFPWDATAAGPGMHTFIATAKDAAGNTVTAMATVTVPAKAEAAALARVAVTIRPPVRTTICRDARSMPAAERKALRRSCSCSVSRSYAAAALDRL